MLFNTLSFLLAFSIIFVLYWSISSGNYLSKKIFLLFVSYILYINFNPSFSLILLSVTLITYIGGYVFEKYPNRRVLLLFVFLILSIFPLFIFKYYNFINHIIFKCLSIIGLRFSLPGLNWAIPIGISFYTFQAVGYMLDVYYGRINKENSILDYSLFVSFFPQIVSGPISKASELLPQIKAPHPFDYDQALNGFRFFLWGLFLKVSIANRTGIYVDHVFNGFEHYSGLGCILASFMYSIQIYSDFAGYSLMAVGVGKLLGFELINNFRRPYFSVSITDFWHRWHISLSRWLKDYVYIPLGGSHCSRINNYWNIFVTFLVSGIWHGANWTFIIWGIIHGGCQIIEKILGWNKIEYKGLKRGLRIVFTFIVITLAWVIFRSPSISEACKFMWHYFSRTGMIIPAGDNNLWYIVICLIPFTIYEFLMEFAMPMYNRLSGITFIRWMTYFIISCMILLFGVLDGSTFIYANF